MPLDEKGSILQDVKIYLGITWDSDDEKISGILKRGAARLESIAGVPLNFDEEALPRDLLFDFCRYGNSQALEMFEKNFSAELTRLYLCGRIEEAEHENQNTGSV